MKKSFYVKNISILCPNKKEPSLTFNNPTKNVGEISANDFIGRIETELIPIIWEIKK